ERHRRGRRASGRGIGVDDLAQEELGSRHRRDRDGPEGSGACKGPGGLQGLRRGRHLVGTVLHATTDSTMICVLQAEEQDRDEVLRLVENLLRELEDAADEFGGIERRKILQDLERAGRRFTAFLARDAAGEAIGVATVVETFAIYAGGVFGVIDE